MGKIETALWLSCIVLAATLAYPAMAQTRPHAAAYLSTKTVMIDGKWTTPDEWTDAANVTFGALDRFHVKHDGQFLYVLVDFVSDSTSDVLDRAMVCLDTKNDGGSSPKTDDYTFIIRWNGDQHILRMMIGIGSEWGSEGMPVDDFLAAASIDAGSPHSSSPHWVYEFRIPKTIMQSSTQIGLRVLAGDKPLQTGSMVWWPARCDPSQPGTWGLLSFAAVPIPEFSIQAIPYMLLIVLSLTLFLRDRARPKRTRQDRF